MGYYQYDALRGSGSRSRSLIDEHHGAFCLHRAGWVWKNHPTTDGSQWPGSTTVRLPLFVNNHGNIALNIHDLRGNCRSKFDKLHHKFGLHCQRECGTTKINLYQNQISSSLRVATLAVLYSLVARTMKWSTFVGTTSPFLFLGLPTTDGTEVDMGAAKSPAFSWVNVHTPPK